MNQQAKEGQIQTMNAPGASFPELMSQAALGKLDTASMKELLDQAFRWEANEARKAFHKAMAAFKENPPVIVKDKTVAYQSSKGPVNYRHASLANVCEKINMALSKHGLSAGWETNQDENGKISVTCKITHEKGHSEKTVLSGKPDDSGAKNAIQAIGSAVSYLQRYTLLALTGLSTAEQDDDGAQTAQAVEVIDAAQVITIKEYLETLKSQIDPDKFLIFMGIEKIEDMPKADYKKAIDLFKTKEAKK